jgi:cell wall-associated NlpC family hydrolase
MLLGSTSAHRCIARIPRRRGRLSTLIVATALALFAMFAAAPVPAGAAPPTDLAAAHARAKQLETQIDANNQRIEILDEQYNRTQASITEATNRIAAAQRQLDVSVAHAANLRQRVVARAAQLYMGSGTPSPLPDLDATTVRQLGARAKYSNAATDRDQHLLDEVKLAQEQLGRERADLQRQRAAAEAQTKELSRARRDVEQAISSQQRVLSKVKGQIATLVANIAAAKQRAEEATARARMQRLAAEQRATSTSTSGSSPSLLAQHSGDSGPAVAPPPPGSGASVAVAVAEAQLGKPYVYAGAGPDVFDCSGLTMYAWGKAGVSMPHSATLQYEMFPHVSIDQLQPGDLLVFGHPIHHVGMYVGGGTMIEAPHTGAVVRYASMYRSDYVGASRP